MEYYDLFSLFIKDKETEEQHDELNKINKFILEFAQIIHNKQQKSKINKIYSFPRSTREDEQAKLPTHPSRGKKTQNWKNSFTNFGQRCN